MRISNYAAIERIDFIREGGSFTLSEYMRKYEIFRRTAFRDFNFINTYRRKACKLICRNGIYRYTEENLNNADVSTEKRMV